MTIRPPGPTAATLFRDVGLLADGPGVWGRPISTAGPGVYIVELPDPPDKAPLEMTRVGKWLERVPGLLLDGERPTSRALLGVLAGAWLPGEPVLYVGATSRSIGSKLVSLFGQVPGDPRPHPDGQWLHLLLAGSISKARVWWASTDAPEEYLDALLDLFSATNAAGALPWANTRSPGGRRRETGISGALLRAEERAATPATRIVNVPDGVAEGAGGHARRTGTIRKAPRAPRAAVPASRAASGRGEPLAAPERADPISTELTADGFRRLQAELDELIGTKRPQVIARIRAAKELGDLKENADYSAAREEQSFLEGRVQAIEARLRMAVVVDGGTLDGRARLGTEMDLEEDGDRMTYALVGAAESDPGAGRISVDSPVGKALVGARAGDEVVVRTPRGEARYRVVAVR